MQSCKVLMSISRGHLVCFCNNDWLEKHWKNAVWGVQDYCTLRVVHAGHGLMLGMMVKVLIPVLRGLCIQISVHLRPIQSM